MLNIQSLPVGRDGDRLDQELITASEVVCGLFLHRLKEHYPLISLLPFLLLNPPSHFSSLLTLNLHVLTRLNATRVWSHAVPIES